MATQEAHTQHANGPLETFVGVRPLATPMGFSEDEVHSIADAVNPIVADALSLYVKTKNYHWHLAGSHFRDYHLLFDEQADQILDSVDILAERVRRIGGTTIRSIGHISRLQTLEDDDDAFVPAEQMLRRLMDDNRRLAELQRAAHEVCGRNRDVATTSELETIIDATERRTWFLFETCQSISNAEQ
jgi:starvation-inducible DNA-binding protein